MLVTAEIRWFWRRHPPAGLEDWFRQPGHHACPVGGGESRVDCYLRDGNSELGMKRRGEGAGLEVKGLVVRGGELAVGPFSGTWEIWSKWNCPLLQFPAGTGTIETRKTRWVRLWDTTGSLPLEIPLGPDGQTLEGRACPARGCQLELTQVTVHTSEEWWTFGFESFGGLRTVGDDLQKTAAAVGERWEMPRLDGLVASYPAWLSELVA